MHVASLATRTEYGDDRSEVDASAELWRRLTKAADRREFATAWLALQANLIGAVRRGVVVADDGPGTATRPLAQWPDNATVDGELAAVAELAMDERRGAVRGRPGADDGVLWIAWPIIVDERLCGVIALELAQRDAPALEQAMRRLQWGSGWLDSMLRRRGFTPKDCLIVVLELVATSIEHREYRAASMALATELAQVLGCEWVALGARPSRHARVVALSHSADFGARTNLLRAIADAMDEAMDQQASIAVPELARDTPRAVRAHSALADAEKLGAVVSVPMCEGERVIGAATLARSVGKTFDAAEVDLVTHALALAGPPLDAKRREERWLAVKAWGSLQGVLTRLVGPRYLGLKLASMASAAVVAWLWFAEADYMVTADATLEGSVQRVVAAPMNGYIESVYVRAGDVVAQGELLATLDDRELALEHLRWVNVLEERRRQYSRELAAKDRAQVRILASQVDQAEAQLALVDAQLTRTQLRSPFAGLVLSGGLDQALGAPVTRGQTLFTVAPLDDYRVILEVDERDIADVESGQAGHLVLASTPDVQHDFDIRKVTPVSAPAEGRNVFRVEAALNASSEALRPGLQGIAKVRIDRRRRLWIWTHAMIDWWRLWAWSWWPT